MKGFSFDLTGRTVLVTGASSGTGNRFGRILAASGANVVLCARRTALLEQLREEIAATGGRAIGVEMDVSDEVSTIAAFDAAEAAFGPVDSVVANAGMNNSTPVLTLAADDLDSVLAVNLRGVFLTVREGARRMIAAGSAERGHGRIVIISSITAEHVSPGTAVYSATKAAVSQLGRVLARDWSRKGINVNILAPGYMMTELTGGWLASPGGQKQLAGYPRRRAMDVDALDPLLLYLCADASAQITGSSFTVDDGQSL